MDLGLQDRVCLVTGSTGGIGLETAGLLGEEGARVATCGRSEAPGIGEALHVQADLSLAGEPERAIAAAVDELGGLDVLVNNVGVARQARFEDVADEEWEAYWQLNVMSYVRAVRAAVPQLREAGGGSSVDVSATAGKRPPTRMPQYSVTKAAGLPLPRPPALAEDDTGEMVPRRADCVTIAPRPGTGRSGAGSGQHFRPRRPVRWAVMPETAGRVADAFAERIREQEERTLSPLAVRSYETR